MIKYALIALVLAAVSVSSGWARVGETYEQCVARYGQPHEAQPDDYERDDNLPGSKFVEIYFNDFRLELRFYESKCVSISYAKFNANNDREKLSKEEWLTLIKANSASSAWDESLFKPSFDGYVKMFRNDKKVSATLIKGVELTVADVEYHKKVEEYKTKKKVDNLKNF